MPRCPKCRWFLRFKPVLAWGTWQAWCWNLRCPRGVIDPNQADT